MNIMNTYYYLRISTVTQKFNRQELTIPKGAKTYKDICSGSIAFADRPAAQELLKTVKAGDTIIVQHLDRLGRNTADMHLTLDKLTEMKVNIRIASLKIESLDDQGNKSLMFQLVSGILSVLSEFEKIQIAERRDAGIKSAKDAKKYVGRPANTKESNDTFLKKHTAVVKVLKKHPTLTLREVSAQASNGEYHASPNTVKKVKEMLADI
jgi:DNA invertase Pin-like site-specific DNA recombinase